MGFLFLLFTLLIVALRSDVHWKVSIVTTVLSVNISKTCLLPPSATDPHSVLFQEWLNLDYQGTRSYQIWISEKPGTRTSSVLTAVSISGPSFLLTSAPLSHQHGGNGTVKRTMTKNWQTSAFCLQLPTHRSHIIPKSSLWPLLGDVALWMTEFLVNNSSGAGLSLLAGQELWTQKIKSPRPKARI